MRVIPVSLPLSCLVAWLPSVAITFGRISSTCRKRYGSQASFSSGTGSRLPGGLHFKTLHTYTCVRSRRIPASSLSSSLPAWPTNGIPCLSSWKPGASPTNIRSACGSPTPNTTCVRPCARRHFVQPATWRPKSSSSVSCSAAATASAATATATTQGRLLGGGVRREHRELLAHMRRAAVRAVGLLAVPDELFEVRFALHADVLVDRHRVSRP